MVCPTIVSVSHVVSSFLVGVPLSLPPVCVPLMAGVPLSPSETLVGVGSSLEVLRGCLLGTSSPVYPGIPLWVMLGWVPGVPPLVLPLFHRRFLCPEPSPLGLTCGFSLLWGILLYPYVFLCLLFSLLFPWLPFLSPSFL